MEREDDPQLWDLLGHSKVPEPSPFFARNVVRVARNQPGSSSAAWSWLSWRPLITSFSAVAAIVIAAFTFHAFHHPHPAAGRDSIASYHVSESDLATDLDVLSGDEDYDELL